MNTNNESEKKYKVLFVCLGNICRSPAAHGIFEHIVRENGMQDRIEVDSAGTYGGHRGELQTAECAMRPCTEAML